MRVGFFTGINFPCAEINRYEANNIAHGNFRQTDKRAGFGVGSGAVATQLFVCSRSWIIMTAVAHNTTRWPRETTNGKKGNEKHEATQLNTHR